MATKLTHIQNLRHIFMKSVESVQPVHLLNAANLRLCPKPSVDGDVHLLFQGRTLNITNKCCYVVGFGKAVLGMAVQLERALADRLACGVLSIPTGTLEQFKGVPAMQLNVDTKIRVMEGAPNNQSDMIAMQAANLIKDLASKMTAKDILFVLISGGGSALLPLPRAPLTLTKKMELLLQLAKAGASIEELNNVRIPLSLIKGGRLSLAAQHAHAVISLVISDVVGNPLDLIASGPTCFATREPHTAKNVLLKYNMWAGLSQDIRHLIEMPAEELHCSNNSIYIVGDNRILTATSVQEALDCGYVPFIASTRLTGDIGDLVQMYKDFLQSICDFRRKLIDEDQLRQRFPFDLGIFGNFVETVRQCEKTGRPLLLILAGESTVKVTGNGLGGRNQELALRMSIELHENADLEHIIFLSAGTDGIDGPSPAAGAIGSALVLKEYLRQDGSVHDVKSYLRQSASYTFYKNLKCDQFHVITGHTGTNVMDLQLVLVP